LFAVPFSEGLEELKTVGGRGDLDRDGGAVGGRRLECVLAWVVAARREFEAGGRGEFKGSAGRCWERVCEWVKRERTGEGECGDDVWRSDKCVSSGIRIVAASKVSIVRSDD
jgi:hypothetical protein